MRSSKSRSRSKQNRSRSVGNIINRVFDSSGPDGKVRGTPQQIIDKYNQLARDAQLSNDRVAAENFQQHAEHYLRLLSEAQREVDSRREQQERENRERQAERDRERQERANQADSDIIVDDADSDLQPIVDDMPRLKDTNVTEVNIAEDVAEEKSTDEVKAKKAKSKFSDDNDEETKSKAARKPRTPRRKKTADDVNQSQSDDVAANTSDQPQPPESQEAAE